MHIITDKDSIRKLKRKCQYCREKTATALLRGKYACRDCFRGEHKPRPQKMFVIKLVYLFSLSVMILNFVSANIVDDHKTPQELHPENFIQAEPREAKIKSLNETEIQEALDYSFYLVQNGITESENITGQITINNKSDGEIDWLAIFFFILPFILFVLYIIYKSLKEGGCDV